MFRRKAIVRQQFPLKASSAKTIHKAQGQTKSCVVVDMTTGSRPHHHYVAFSLVTSLQGLYLLNGLSGQIKVDKGVVNEMERLRREAYMEFSYKPVNSHDCDLVIAFQNAQSFRLHLPQVQNDETFTDADVICLVETRLFRNDQDVAYALKGFLPIVRNDQRENIRGVRPPHGLAIYVKDCHKIISSETLSTEKFEALAVKIMPVQSQHIYTIFLVYKAPLCRFENFREHMKMLSRIQSSEKLIKVGDFNFDISRNQNNNFTCFMKTLFPKSKMLSSLSTTRENTVLDLCFTTCDKAFADVITCVWSYHHTLVVSVH